MKNENFSEGVRKTPASAQNEKSSSAGAIVSLREIATEDEVRAQLLALDDDALYRLELRVAGYRRMLPRQDVEELVNEALRRALEGCRKWPKDVPFMVFLFESMRSIAWEFLKQNRREVPDSQIGPIMTTNRTAVIWKGTRRRWVIRMTPSGSPHSPMRSNARSVTMTT